MKQIKKAIYLFLLILIIITSNIDSNSDCNKIGNLQSYNINEYNYIFYIISYVRNKNASHYYTKIIIKNSRKYNLDAIFIARQVYVESRYKFWAVSHAGAIGNMQIIPEYWIHKIYEVDIPWFQKKLQKAEYYAKYNFEMNHQLNNLRYIENKNTKILLDIEELKKRKSNFISYIKKSLSDPEVNIALGCIIMRSLYEKHNRDYGKALLAYYAGPGSYIYQKYKNKLYKVEYVKCILLHRFFAEKYFQNRQQKVIDL